MRLTAFPVLLTATAGAMDATAFLHLGQVFASVMTGNLVLLGVATGTRDGGLAAAAGLAFAGYATGALLGSAVAERAPDTGRRPPRGTLRTLAVELAVLLAFTGLWEDGARSPAQTHALLVLAAAAMGCQSAAIRQVGSPELSTTFLTGTLTRLLARLAGPSGERSLDTHAAARLAALAVGACLAAFTAQQDSALLPAVPLVFLVAGMALAVPRRVGRLR